MVLKKNHSSLSIQGIYFLLIGMCAGESDDRSTSADAVEGECVTRGECVFLKLSWCFVCVGGVWEALAREGNAYRGVLRRCELGEGVVLTHTVSRRGAVMPRGLAWVCVTPRSDSRVLRLRWRRCGSAFSCCDLRF